MHFRKCHQQQVDRIQHQLHTHEYDDGISTDEYPRNSDAEKGD
jgi:hypothetical protein